MGMASRRGFVGATMIGVAVWPWLRAHAAAQGRVRAQFDPPQVQVEEETELSVEIEVSDGQVQVSRPKLSGAKELTVQSLGASRSTSMVYTNGRMQATETHVYSYMVSARKAGTFSVMIEAQIGDETVKLAQPLVLKVADDPAARAASSPKLGQDDTVLITKATPLEVFVGQQVDYVFEVWQRDEGVLNPEKLPSFKDCWVEALPRNETRIQRGGGVPYRVYSVMRQALFPQLTGTLSVSAPVVRVQPSTFGMIFGGRRAGRTKQIVGEEVQIQVLPLPSAGQPAKFSANNVGVYAISAKVDRQEIVQGDAITLTIEVTGEGNVRFAELEGWPAIAGFRRYDPKAEDPKLDTGGSRLKGSKRWALLLIAQEAGKLVIPAHAIAFFDPYNKRYERVESAPITIEVKAKPGFVGVTPNDAGPQNPAQPVDEATPSGDEGVEQADLLTVIGQTPIDRHPGQVRQSPSVSKFWLTWLGMPLGLAGLGWASLTAYQAWANPRRLAAQVERAQENALLQKLAGDTPDVEFLAAIATLLQRRALECAGPRAQGVPRSKLLELLAHTKVPKNHVEAIGRLLDRCDAARFGAGALDPAERAAMASEVRSILIATQNFRGGQH